MTRQNSPFDQLHAHIAARPRITEEVLSSLMNMAKQGSTRNLRDLGALLLEYMHQIQNWMIEQDKLVRALPRHGDDEAIEALARDLLAAPSINQIQSLFEAEEAWRQRVLAKVNALRRVTT